MMTGGLPSACLLGLLACCSVVCGRGMLAAAETPPVAIDMSAAPATVDMGKSVVVTISYRWPRHWRVSGEPNPSLDFADEYVTAVPPAISTSAGGEERRTFALTVWPTRSGAWPLPRPTFSASPPDGEAATARAPEVVVQVGVVDRPIEPPAARPLVMRPPPIIEQPRRLVYWLAGGAAALALAVAMVALRSRRTAEAAPTPREVLARELRAAAGAADGKEAGARASLALRRFAGTVWSFDGPGSTAREAAQTARARGPEDEARELARLLENLDALRWSPDAVAAAELEPLIASGTRWGDAVQRRLDAEAAAAAEEQRRRGAQTGAAA
jgi:hypothetical protein